MVGSICSAVLVYATLAQAQTATRNPWVAALESVKAPVLIDLPSDLGFVPNVGPAIRTREGFQVFGAMMAREMFEVEDAFVFVQSREPGYGPGLLRGDLVAEWLSSEAPSVEKQLLESHLDLRDVNPLGMTNLARCLRHPDGTVQKFVNGEEVQMRLAPTLVIQLPGELGRFAGRPEIALSAGRGYEEHNNPARSDSRSSVRREVGGTPLPTEVADGDLDFGDGRVAQVRDVLAQAEKLWNVRYRLDSRLLNEQVFIKGKFTEERFERAMERLAQTVTYRVIKEHDETPAAKTKEAKERLLSGLVNNLTPSLKDLYAKALNGPVTMTVGELAQLYPAWRNELERAKLGHSQQVTIGKVNVTAFFWCDPSTGPFPRSGFISSFQF